MFFSIYTYMHLFIYLFRLYCYILDIIYFIFYLYYTHILNYTRNIPQPSTKYDYFEFRKALDSSAPSNLHRICRGFVKQ